MQKENHKSIIEGYYYACCPHCKNTLTQGKNGTDIIVKCTKCSQYIHVVIQDDGVMIERKDN